MDKVTLRESKRSIHSTRIDVIAGDLVPIKPVDSLPINTVQRPKVEDPEYTPETSSELAASLSALARIVPHEQVMSVYRAIRDMIEKIAPVTHTSLEYIENLNEARTVKQALDDLISDADQSKIASISRSIDQKIAHLLSVGSDYAISRADSLKAFVSNVRKVVTRIHAIEKSRIVYAGRRYSVDRVLKSKKPLSVGTIKGGNREVGELMRQLSEIDSALADIQRMADEAQSSLTSLISKYDRVIITTPDFEERKRNVAGPSPATNDIITQNLRVDDKNREQIITAYNTRIIELQSSGDSFDHDVAQSTIRRRTAVEKLLKRDNARIDRDLFDSIATSTGDLAQFRTEMLLRKGEPGRADVFLAPRFAPGHIRAIIADKDVHYDPDDPDLDWIASVGHVHVYRRFLQLLDGREIEIRPDVRIDFGGIKHDFVAAAADDLRGQGVNAAVEEASRFFEQNKLWIIKDALNPSRGTYVSDPVNKQRAKTRTPERAALLVANQKLASMEMGQAAVVDAESADRQRRSERSRSSLAFQTRDEELRSAQVEQQIRQTVRTLFLDNTSGEASGRSIAVKSVVQKYVLQLFAQSRYSFGLVANQKIDEMTKRGIAQPESNASSAGEVEKVRARVEAVVSEAVSIAEKIKQSAREGSLQASLSETLDELIQARKTNASLSLDRAARLPGVTVSDGYRSAFFKVRQLSALGIASNRSMGRKDVVTRRTKTPTESLDYSSLAGIARAFGKAAQLFSNDDVTTVDTSKLLVETARGQLEGVMTRGVKSLVTKSGNMRFAGMAKPISPDSMSPATVSLTGRILAEIQRVFPSSATRAELAANANSKAFQHFGIQLGSDNSDDMFPIFVDDSLSDLIKSAGTGDTRRREISSSVADVIFGVPGVSGKMIDHVRKMSSDSAYLAISADADALSHQIFEDISSDFKSDNIVAILRTLVAVACEVREILRTEKAQQEDTGDDALINSFITKIDEIVKTGLQGPEIDIRALRRGAVSSYMVSVDLKESGVGYFVDDAQRPVARVVGMIDRLDSNVDGYDYAEAFSFLDKKLMQLYAQTEPKLVDHIMQEIASPGNPKISQTRRLIDIVSDEVRRQLVLHAFKRAAGDVNLRFMSGSGAKVTLEKAGTADPQRALSAYISSNTKIAEDPDMPRFTRDVAKAAVNYAITSRQLPEAEKGIEYYTPVGDDAGVDPTTGQKLLKRGIVYVKGALPLSMTNPSLPACPPGLDTRFLESVYHLVDTHVLSSIDDWNGPIRLLKAPESDEQKRRFDAIQTSVARPGAADAASLEGAPSRAGFERLVRSATMKDRQVLSVNSVISPGMPGEEIEKLRDETRVFLVGMMLRMGKAGGYIIVNDETDHDGLLDQRLKSLSPSTNAAAKLLNSAANAILEAANDHITEQIRAYGIEYKTVVLEQGDGDKKESVAVYRSVSELQSAAKIKARAAIINRIATLHHTSLGYGSPVAIPYDPVTGYVDPPTSPKKFFNEKMGNLAINRDPLTYITHASRVYREYQEMIAKKYGIVTSGKGHEASLLGMLENDFPLLYAEIKDDMRKRIASESSGLDGLTHVSQLNINAETGEIVGIGSSVNPAQAKGLIAQLYEAAASFDVILRRSALGVRFENQVDSVKTKIDVFSRIIGTGMTSFNVVQQFNEIAGTVNSITDQVSKSETDRLSAAADKIFTDDVTRVCRVEIKRLEESLRAFLTAKEKSKDPTGMQRLTQEEQRLIASSATLAVHDQYLNLKKIVSYAASDTRPTFNAIGDDFIDRLEEEHKIALEEISKVRAKAQRVANHAQKQVDDEIRSMATKYAGQISAKLHRKVGPGDLTIVDTIDELDSLKEKLENEKKIALLESGITNETKIATSIEAYLEGVLGGMIFGVRNTIGPTGA